MTVREINRAIRAGQRVRARYRVQGKDEEGDIRQARILRGVLEVQTMLGNWYPVVVTIHVWVER